MKKTVAISLLFLMMLSVFTTSASASSDWVSVVVEGEKFTGNVQVRDGMTFVGIRSFSKQMYPDARVSYDYSSRTLTVKTDKLTLTCKDGASYVVANGRYLYTESPVYMKNGVMYAPVILLARAFDAKISWSDAQRGFSITRGTGGIKSGDSYYREDEVYWLSKIIYAESGAEPMIGKIAVGNVVLNRVRSSAFPNTIYSVIFDRKYGVQFSPVENGTIYNTPNADSIIAAKICLEGYTVSNEILYFVNPSLAPNSWVAKNRPYFDTIGNHYFFT